MIMSDPTSTLPPWLVNPPPWASGAAVVEVEDADDEPSPFSAESGPADYTVDDDERLVWIGLDGMLFRFSIDTLMTYQWD